MASSVELGPGIRLHAANMPRNSRSPTQRRRSTTWRLMSATWATGPPNAASPTRSRTRLTSQAPGRSVATGLSRSAPGGRETPAPRGPGRRPQPRAREQDTVGRPGGGSVDPWVRTSPESTVRVLSVSIGDDRSTGPWGGRDHRGGATDHDRRRAGADAGAAGGPGPPRRTGGQRGPGDPQPAGGDVLEGTGGRPVPAGVGRRLRAGAAPPPGGALGGGSGGSAPARRAPAGRDLIAATPSCGGRGRPQDGDWGRSATVKVWLTRDLTTTRSSAHSTHSFSTPNGTRRRCT